MVTVVVHVVDDCLPYLSDASTRGSISKETREEVFAECFDAGLLAPYGVGNTLLAGICGICVELPVLQDLDEGVRLEGVPGIIVNQEFVQCRFCMRIKQVQQTQKTHKNNL